MRYIYKGEFEFVANIWMLAAWALLIILMPAPLWVELVLFLLCFQVHRIPPGGTQCP